MNRQSGTEHQLAMSYLGLRKAIGFIGVFLPLVLVLGKIFIEGTGIQGSISAYYYTVMRDVFVGSLCAIGVFLMSYRYQKYDTVAAILAGIFAVAVAVFPTAPATAATTTRGTRSTRSRRFSRASKFRRIRTTSSTSRPATARKPFSAT